MTDEELKKWREEQKLTQEGAAIALNVKVDTWRRWEQGVSRIPNILALAIQSYKPVKGLASCRTKKTKKK